VDVVDDLLARGAAHRERARAVRGYTSAAMRGDLDAAIAAARSAALRRLDRGRLQRLAALVQERRAFDAHDLRTRERAQAEIQRALGRLRRLDSLESLVARAPRELCRACGFTRAMISRVSVSRVSGSTWVPLLPPPGVDEDADAFRRALGEDLELALRHTLLEAEMVRRRIAILVPDASNDSRCHGAFVRTSGSNSYVGAPIISGQQVVGFLHADRHDQRHPVTVEDREDLRLYAEHFGLLHERASVARMVDRRMSAVLVAQQTLATQLAGLAAQDLTLSDLPLTDALLEPVPRATEGETLAAATLTARETEILGLIARGGTNRAIALELVLSENTVKTHIAKASRKLRARSRADALARYLTLQAAER
jgi:DNA-binding CsgD family transcriptional regulator